MSWYTPESWQALRTVADDRDKLADSFEDFVAGAERCRAGFAKRGIAVEKLLLDVGDLVRWCRREGYRVEGKGRAAYGAHLMCLRAMPVEGRA
jgi:hypothetical protein